MKFVCDVCLISQDDAKKAIRVWNCQHTFCHECLQSLRSSSDGLIKCPSCQQSTAANEENFVQTNDSLSSTSSKVENVHSVKEIGYWCVTCKMIAKKACMSISHEKCRLDTVLGRELAERHLKSVQSKCSQLWDMNLAKRKEADKNLSGVTKALRYLLREVETIEKMNKQKMKQIEKNLKVLSETRKKYQNHNKLMDSDLVLYSQKYTDLIGASKNDVKEVNTELTSSFSSLRNAVVSLEVKTEDDRIIPTSLVEGKRICFENEANNQRDHQAMVALSYIILSCTEDGKIFRQYLQSKRSINETDDDEVMQPTSVAFRIAAQAKGVGNELECNQTTCKGARPKGSQFPCNHSSTNVIDSTLDKEKDVETFKLTSQTIKNKPPFSRLLFGKKCYLDISVNRNPYGRIIIELRPDLAPNMCRRFAELCKGTFGSSYQGTTISRCEPKSFIIGGRTAGPEDLFTSDKSPLRRCRGAVLLRLKRDVEKIRSCVVANEFIIQLNDEKKESSWSSTVFGYVIDGINVCDSISLLDPKKVSVLVTKAGMIQTLK